MSKLHETLYQRFGRENLPALQEDLSEPLAAFLSRTKESMQYCVVYIHQPSHGLAEKFLTDYLANEKFVTFVRETDNVKLWVASYNDSLGKRGKQL